MGYVLMYTVSDGRCDWNDENDTRWQEGLHTIIKLYNNPRKSEKHRVTNQVVHQSLPIEDTPSKHSKAYTAKKGAAE